MRFSLFQRIAGGLFVNPKRISIALKHSNAIQSTASYRVATSAYQENLVDFKLIPCVRSL